MIESAEKLNTKIGETEKQLHTTPSTEHLIQEYNKGLLKAYRDCLPLVERLERELNETRKELEKATKSPYNSTYL